MNYVEIDTLAVRIGPKIWDMIGGRGVWSSFGTLCSRSTFSRRHYQYLKWCQLMPFCCAGGGRWGWLAKRGETGAGTSCDRTWGKLISSSGGVAMGRYGRRCNWNMLKHHSGWWWLEHLFHVSIYIYILRLRIRIHRLKNIWDFSIYWLIFLSGVYHQPALRIETFQDAVVLALKSFRRRFTQFFHSIYVPGRRNMKELSELSAFWYWMILVYTICQCNIV